MFQVNPIKNILPQICSRIFIIRITQPPFPCPLAWGRKTYDTKQGCPEIEFDTDGNAFKICACSKAFYLNLRVFESNEQQKKLCSKNGAPLFRFF